MVMVHIEKKVRLKFKLCKISNCEIVVINEVAKMAIQFRILGVALTPFEARFYSMSNIENRKFSGRSLHN